MTLQHELAADAELVVVVIDQLAQFMGISTCVQKSKSI
jgi:hypothetical protein